MREVEKPDPLHGYFACGFDLLEVTGRSVTELIQNRIPSSSIIVDVLRRANRRAVSVWAFSNHRKSAVVTVGDNKMEVPIVLSLPGYEERLDLEDCPFGIVGALSLRLYLRGSKPAQLGDERGLPFFIDLINVVVGGCLHCPTDCAAVSAAAQAFRENRWLGTPPLS